MELDENGCPTEMSFNGLFALHCPPTRCGFCKDYDFCISVDTCSATVDWAEVAYTAQTRNLVVLEQPRHDALHYTPAQKVGSKMASLYDLGLNMTDIRSNEGIESLPRGRFSFEIARFEEAETSAEAKNPGALMYKVGLKCTGPDQYSGKWVFDQIVLAGPRLRDNMGRLRALLEAAGIPTEEIDDQKFRPTTEWGQINLIGRTVDADVYPTPATDQYRAGNGVSAYYSHEFGDAELL